MKYDDVTNDCKKDGQHDVMHVPSEEIKPKLVKFAILAKLELECVQSVVLGARA